MIRFIFRRRTFLLSLALLLGLGLLVPTSMAAGDVKVKDTLTDRAADVVAPPVTPPVKAPLLKRIGNCFRKMTYQPKQTSPRGMSYGVAAPNQGPAPTQGPNTPWYGYGMGVPTYDYGWFGATYRPAKVSHTGYYGGTYQWGYRRGY